jgi:hypothetical protein
MVAKNSPVTSPSILSKVLPNPVTPLSTVPFEPSRHSAQTEFLRETWGIDEVFAPDVAS